MTAKCLNRKKYLLAASLMLVGVLLMSYSAVANAQRRDKLESPSTVGGEPGERDRDTDYIEKRGEFLNRFFGTGPGGVSPTAYEAGRTMARVLPPSPLLRNESFRSPGAPEVSELWTLPIAPPIEQSYGGNAGARVHTLAVDPFNANVVYTGGFGGLAKTSDGGFTWQYLSDAWTSQSVSAIAVDPNASRIVYAGTGRDDYGPYSVGLYRSFDGGLTWSRPLGADHFAGTYMDEPDRPSQADVGIEFGMTENAVKQAFYRFRQRYQTLLREQIAHTVATPGDVEDELRYLISVVRT